MNPKLEAKYIGLFRRQPPDAKEGAFNVLLLGVVTALKDQYGEAGAAKYLNAALTALSKPSKQ